MPFLGKTPAQIVDPEVDIDGGSIDGATIGATSASAATVTTFTSTGIDDNSTSTAITIDASENVGIGKAPACPLNVASDDYVKVVVEDVSGTDTPFSIGSGVNAFTIANNTSGNLDDEAITLNQINQSIIFTTAGSERLRILSSGGITFNGETTAAHALDDYEEGTWTPVLTGTSSGTKNLAGTYTKIGRCVTVRIGHWTAIPSGTLAGSLYITGLPFNSANNPWGNNGGIASSGLLHIRGTAGGIGTTYAPWALIETNTIKLHDSANFGNTSVYAGQGATFGSTKVSQNGSTSIIIDWTFSYMTT